MYVSIDLVISSFVTSGKCFFIISALGAFSQTYPGHYLIRFTDKNNNPFSLDRPEEFLSERAIQRRIKQNIPLSTNDLPVNPSYTDSLRAMGVPVYNISKWFNLSFKLANVQLFTVSKPKDIPSGPDNF